MKNIVYAVLALGFISISSTVHALDVHVVPLAEKDGEWYVLLNLPSGKSEWESFSATVPADKQPGEIAQEILQQYTYGSYQLAPNTTEIKLKSGNNVYLPEVTFTQVEDLNAKVPSAYFWQNQPPIQEFAWVSVADIKNTEAQEKLSIPSNKPKEVAGRVVEGLTQYRVNQDVLTNLKKIIPDNYATTPLAATLNNLTNSLTTLKTALAG